MDPQNERADRPMTASESRHRCTVGVLLDNHLYTGMSPAMFFTSVIRGIQTAAREQGVNLMVACGVLHGNEQS